MKQLFFFIVLAGAGLGPALAQQEKAAPDEMASRYKATKPYKATKEFLYAGTFSERGSKGLYVLEFDRTHQSLKEIQVFSGGKDPNFVALHPGGHFLYAVFSEGVEKKAAGTGRRMGSVSSFSIDPLTGALTRINEQSSEGGGPAHVSVDPKGRFVYVSNYGGGNFAVYPIKEDGSLGAPSDVIKDQGSGPMPEQEGPHVHCVIPSADGRYIYSSDLGIDEILIYKVTDSGKMLPAEVPYVKSPPGAGPRHFAIDRDGRFAFSAEEFHSTITSYRVDPSNGALVAMEHLDMLPKERKPRNSDTDIHLSPDGKFLYASNSGAKGLAVFSIDSLTGKLQRVEDVYTEGLFPRNFCLDKSGAYVFVANRDTDNIAVFKRNSRTGRLSFTGQTIKVPMVVSLQHLANAGR